MNRLFQLSVIASAISLSSIANAANVEIFGVMDAGFTYLHENMNSGMAGPQGQRTPNVLNAAGKVTRNGSKTSFKSGSGNVGRFGFRGSEKISDDVTVQFHLEQAFVPDDGGFYNSSKMFERESSLGIRSNSYGLIKFGRMPAITSGSGTTGIFNTRVNPLAAGAGTGNMSGGWKFTGVLGTVRYDNTVYYESPNFAGNKVYLQYSNGSSDSTEGTSRDTRFYAAAVTRSTDRYFLALGADWTNVPSYGIANGTYKLKDAYRVMLGGHYKFDNCTIYGTVQYMKNVPYIGAWSTKEFAPVTENQQASTSKVGKNNGFKAWSVTTGYSQKLFSGSLGVSVGYGQGENQNVSENNKYQRANVGLMYTYFFSKRTYVYGIVGGFWQKADWQDSHINANEVVIGMQQLF